MRSRWVMITAVVLVLILAAVLTAGPGTEIQLDGDTFAFKRIVKAPQGDLEIVYKGTVSGDTFTGTGEIMGYVVPYNGVRIAAGS